MGKQSKETANPKRELIHHILYIRTSTRDFSDQINIKVNSKQASLLFVTSYGGSKALRVFKCGGFGGY